MSKYEKYYRHIPTGSIYKGTAYYLGDMAATHAKLRPEQWEEVIVTPAPKPRTQTLYVNVYPAKDELYTGSEHSTRGSADAHATSGRIGCVRVDLVEGRYDE